MRHDNEMGTAAKKAAESKRQRKRNAALTILLCGFTAVGLAPAQTSAPAATAPPAVSALAEKPLTLNEAVQAAVLNNPEVLARYHTVRAAEGERDAAKGGLYPRADLTASTGPERRSDVDGRYSRSFATLSLTQLLWDGQATRREVARLDYATRVRIFELVAAAEGMALEASRAYFDVLRYRELVRLAEDNFVEHRTVFAQTDQRVKAKVARAVDLEQITGRLALAEANLLIETSNLHDTSARFQRLVGRVPTREMPLPPYLLVNLPRDINDALARTQGGNALIQAAIENVRASQAALETRQGAYQPRFDFRVKRDQGRNLDGLPGGSNATVAELVMNWNLFNGFADQARERQYAEQVNISRDNRDKTCRDTRQTTAIAYNDVVKLKEQLDYLTLHESSLTKALVAYRQQFQIGQRTLLDLLDTENELFQARRAVVNARYDLSTAYVRVHAGIGDLLPALQVAGPQTGREEELQSWSAGADAVQQCPLEPVPVYTVDKDSLVQKALLNVRPARPDAPGTGMTSVIPPAGALPPSATITPPGIATASPSPASPPTVVVGPVESAVRMAVQSWRDAWARRDVTAYLAAYAPTFTPEGGVSRDAWAQRRRAVITKATDVSLELADVQVRMLRPDAVVAEFTQSYRSGTYQDRVRKTLEFARLDGRWQIVRESSTPAVGR